MPTRIAQLTDPHLLTDPDGRLRGVPTRQTFVDVLEHVRGLEGGFDYLVLTGDLAQDEVPATYRVLADLLGDWRDRCRLVPGNHDNLDGIRQVFPDLVPVTGGPLTFCLVTGGWRVIGLDSHVPGETWGRLDAPQIAWLREQLEREPELPALLFVHHPPVSLGAPWLDEIGLQDAEPFLQLIADFPRIKAVSCGHVHQVLEGTIAHAAVFTTPSTAFQFERECPGRVDPQAPGYRWFELDGDQWRTGVERLPELTYPGV